ncbi:MAG: inorganic phosphate transporter [Pseudomonadales bacterium]|nr:inorganic phosphate transporter [Pseudomonadales bacterium]
MDLILVVVIAAIVAVLIFDFTNGVHDASNMVATLVASRAMAPGQALSLVAVFTFLGPILGGTAVADTIGGFVDLSHMSTGDAIGIVVSGIAGAISWNLITWYFAVPSSSSHALVGGLVGAVLIGANSGDVVWGISALHEHRLVGVTKVLATLFFSPLVGFAAGYLVQAAMRWMLRSASPGANQVLMKAQWVTAALLAFAHGTNDAQKGMGIITLMLVLGGMLGTFAVPTWVILASASAITLGTAIGGWRIVRTVGYGIFRLRPLHGLDAQLSSASVILGASLFGGPVSTTHVVSSSIMGIGAYERPRAVRWNTARDIGLTWLLTLPGSACLAGVAYALFSIVGHLFR